jgi:hypothetical protein
MTEVTTYKKKLEKKLDKKAKIAEIKRLRSLLASGLKGEEYKMTMKELMNLRFGKFEGKAKHGK